MSVNIPALSEKEIELLIKLHDVKIMIYSNSLLDNSEIVSKNKIDKRSRERKIIEYLIMIGLVNKKPLIEDGFEVKLNKNGEDVYNELHRKGITVNYPLSLSME